MCRSTKLSMLLVLLLIVRWPRVLPRRRQHLRQRQHVSTKQLPLPMPSTSGKFDVGGHSLYLECYGEGSPTVVLENAFGDNLSWVVVSHHPQTSHL